MSCRRDGLSNRAEKNAWRGSLQPDGRQRKPVTHPNCTRRRIIPKISTSCEDGSCTIVRHHAHDGERHADHADEDYSSCKHMGRTSCTIKSWSSAFTCALCSAVGLMPVPVSCSVGQLLEAGLPLDSSGTKKTRKEISACLARWRDRSPIHKKGGFRVPLPSLRRD